MENWETLYKADINISTSGDNTIIDLSSLDSTEKANIVIDHINLVPSSAVSVQLKDGSTNYGGAYPLSANQGFVLENTIEHNKGVITLGTGNDFVINLDSAVQVSGFVRYRLLNF